MSRAGKETASAGDASPRVSLSGAYRFFLPLVFMTELNMISKSVIHAFLARTADPSVTLAAFNTAFTFYYTVTSATEVITYLTISYLRDRTHLARIVGFVSLVVSVPVALAWLVAFTALGDWLYGTVFGASAQTVAQARTVTFVLSISAPILVARGVAFALLMMNRRTPLITLSTLVRLLSLAGSLLLWPLALDGAAIGAAALVTCMLAETVFAWAFAARNLRELPRAGTEAPGAATMWRFSWPLVLNQTSEIGAIFVVNLFLGRLAHPDLALAAFGVVHGLVGLLFSPMRNLVQTAQTLVANRDDARVMVGFTLQLVAFFATLAYVLFHTSLETWVLRGVMGLTAELADYCVPAMRACFAMALFWALAALFRGLLAGARTTGMLAVTGGLRVVTVTVVGMATVVSPTLNGALVGLAAWILAYVAEVVVLGWRLRRAHAL
ncbi:MAG: hypothetical protein H6983_09835 [Ectothiorhodospiraceae bacterium]|nr:hypothetical protein [Chromatiales bacterium]MCP5154454.1 hypothetical protein [Ectothiorhodospiraceae bacterium]